MNAPVKGEIQAAKKLCCRSDSLRSVEPDHPGGDGVVSHFINQYEGTGRAGDRIGIRRQRLLQVDLDLGDIVQLQSVGRLFELCFDIEPCMDIYRTGNDVPGRVF